MKVHMRADGEKGSDHYHCCDKCGVRFANRNYLNRHIRSAHDKIPFECTECPMAFPRYSALVTHRNMSHSTDERFNCKHCGRRFGRLPHARLHEKTHEDPQFQCKFCAKLVRSKEKLVAHERFHTGERPFVCNVCGNGYVSKPALSQHKEFMHDDAKRQHMQNRQKIWCLKQKKRDNQSYVVSICQ